MTDPESEKAMRDAMLYGTGFMQDGKRIAPDDVYVKPDDAEALAMMWAKRGYVSPPRAPEDYTATATCKEALDTATTLRAQAAALERERASHRQSVEIGHAFANDAKAQKARAEKAEAERDTAYARGLKDAIGAAGDLRGRDVPKRDAEDAGEAYDLAIDEAQAAIRALAPDSE